MKPKKHEKVLDPSKETPVVKVEIAAPSAAPEVPVRRHRRGILARRGDGDADEKPRKPLLVKRPSRQREFVDMSKALAAYIDAQHEFSEGHP